jgi:Fur family transcriptional regulator, ferric uptake regulator
MLRFVDSITPGKWLGKRFDWGQWMSYHRRMESESIFQFGSGMGPSVPELVAVLKSAGHFNTHARRAVLEALCAAPGPLNPSDILWVGRQHHEALGLVTVYRTLEVLQGLGLVSKLHLQDGCHSYMLSTAGIERKEAHDGQVAEHGHHVICSACGRAVEFDGCDVEAVVAAVETKTGFKVQDHWLELFGLCPHCHMQEGASE